MLSPQSIQTSHRCGKGQICLIRIKQNHLILLLVHICFKTNSIININHRRHSYHLLCRHTSSTIKSVISYWKLDFRHESRQGASCSPLRDILSNASGLHTLGNPWIFRAGPLLRLRIGNSWTHVSRSLQTYNRGASQSNNHKGEK